MRLRELYDLSFRLLETELRNISKIFKFHELTFTLIYKRLGESIPEIQNDSSGVLVAIDFSGFKITLKSGYLENKRYRIRKGWIKLHAIININNFQIMDYSIANEHINDAKNGIKIVRRIKNKIDKLYDNKGYDSKLIYNELDGKAVIPTRKNAITLSKGSLCRTRITRFNEGLWKINKNYSLIWTVQIYFSGMKRLFSEIIIAVKQENIVQEMMLKVYFYNEYSKLRGN